MQGTLLSRMAAKMSSMLQGVVNDILQPLPQSFSCSTFCCLLLDFFVISLSHSVSPPLYLLLSLKHQARRGRWKGQKAPGMRHLLPNKTDKENRATKPNATERQGIEDD